MEAGARLVTAAAVLAIAGCGANNGELKIRAMPTPLAQGERPVSFRVAEARAQFALGNVALALESFRKAQREEPGSIDAVLGIAACYDRMGRFDLSDRYIQTALAIDPDNADALTALAASLTLQGKPADAAKVRQELAANQAPAVVANVESTPQPAAPAAPDRLAEVALAIAAAAEPPLKQSAPAASVTITLPEIAPERPVESGADEPVARKVRATVAHAARLERTSLGEVALITSGGPVWKSEVVDRSRVSTTVRFVPMRAEVQREAAIRLLNAARVHRLAARTRSLLAEVGWTRMTVGDAPATRRRSLIVYPASDRAAAERLAARFGFQLARNNAVGRLTIYLGSDAVPIVSKRT